MKKKKWLYIGILLISALSATLFASCDKDTWCYLDVTAVEMDKTPVANAWVKIDMEGSTIFDKGYTESNGVYSTKFAAPAIFNITVRVPYIDTLNPNTPYYREGIKSVRLKEGETVSETVVIEEEIKRGEIDPDADL